MGMREDSLSRNSNGKVAGLKDNKAHMVFLLLECLVQLVGRRLERVEMRTPGLSQITMG